MASLSDLPGISGENSRLRNGIVGVGYVFLLLMVIGAASPAEDTDPASSTPTDTPDSDTPADTEQDTQTTPTATQAPETETEAPSSSGGSDGGSDSSDSSSSGYQVRISYDGNWQGSLGGDGSARSVDGSGTETFDIEGDPFVVSANAQKQDDSSKELTIEIIKDGEVVADQSTSAEYGMAQTST